MPIPTLRNQRVLVIGGTSGIGYAIAHGALAEGADVVVGSSSAARVADAVARLGGTTTGAVVDVRDEASVAGFFDQVGAFDHLAFTAGDWGPNRGGGTLDRMDLAGANPTFQVRFWGALMAIRHAQPHLSPEGSITLTNGMIAHRPRKEAALSSAMAGAIEHLTRALAVDLAPLRVNAVCPGYVLTEVWNSIPEDRREAQLQRMTARQPLPRAGDPDEVAQAYLYLMRGGFTTGQVLIVDGGMALV